MDYTYAKNIIDNSLNILENDYIVQKDYKEEADKMWAGIKTVCKASWKIVKDAFIGFFTSIYTWLTDTITGIGQSVMAFGSFFIKALGGLLFGLIQLGFDKVIEWVKKW